MVRALAGTLLLLSLVACQSIHVPSSSRPPTDVTIGSAVEMWKLELKDALALSSSLDFSSAIALAAMRPTPRSEVAELILEVEGGVGVSPLRSVVRFSQLPNGLEHVSHDVPANADSTALHETFVEAYGVANVLYWNSRFSGSIPRPRPSEFRLRSGRLFSVDSAFVIEEWLEDGSVIEKSCTPGAPFPASTIHAALTGLASVFECAASVDEGVERLLYLADAARYILVEYREGDERISRFNIVGVTFASARPE